MALDAETKLIPWWFVGQRDASCAYHFIHDLKENVDWPLRSPNEWIPEGFHPIAMGGYIM